MKYVAWLPIGLLICAHLDFRQFSHSELLYDFLPYPLAYHMLISVATAAAWILVVQFCWPDGVDEVMDEGDTENATEETSQ